MKRIASIVLLAGLLAAAAGCHRRPLHDMEGLVAIKVTIDLDTVCNIKSNIYNDQIAKPNAESDMLRVFLYDHKTHQQVAQTFISENSYDQAGHQVFTGYMNINYGTFDFLIYNFDTPNTLIKGENNEDEIEAYTSSMSQNVAQAFASANTGINENSLISYQPDHLMVAQEQNYYIAPHTDIVTMETTAHTCINTYYIQIHVEGMQYVAGCSAVISGLYSGNKFGRNPGTPVNLGERIADPSTAVYFNLEKSTDKNIAGENKDVLCALFNTFGKIEDISSDLYVTFNAVDTEGNQIKKEVSLDVVFRSADALERHWLLLDETWIIDDPNPHPVGGGGFQPVVDDWEEQHGEIEL